MEHISWLFKNSVHYPQFEEKEFYQWMCDTFTQECLNRRNLRGNWNFY